MTEEEILKGLYENTVLGKAPEVKSLTQTGLDQKMDPVVLLYQALLRSSVPEPYPKHDLVKVRQCA